VQNEIRCVHSHVTGTTANIRSSVGSEDRNLISRTLQVMKGKAGWA
jgi:hypothetical protein